MSDDIRLAIRFQVPVLITASRDHWRYRLARHIHESSRPDYPFVTIGLETGVTVVTSQDPSPVSHARGTQLALPDARGGTLFVDHLEQQPLAVWEDLLGLVTGHPRPAAAAVSRQVMDSAVRLIVGARGSMAAERQDCAMLENLFYRLNVIHIDLTVVT